MKNEKNAVILAHTYQPGDVQDVADYVGDSYGLSVQATKVDADVIVFCGVLFMAETAAILNPSKKVILPEATAGCPMADMITAEELADLKRKYPEYTVVCYVNSTAAVKALSDICCTSSNAVKIVQQLPKDKGIIFVPDKYLGGFVQEQTGHENMVLWDGFCPTHARITPQMIEKARKEHPEAVLMIHPEAPRESRVLADQALSTGGMLKFANASTQKEFIVATEIGLIHTLKKENPYKEFHPISDEVTCPNMRKGSLDSLIRSLEGNGGVTISVPADIATKAELAIRKMLEMSI